MKPLELEVTERADALAKPLRVLHLITGLGLGGAEVMLNRLVSAMDPLRFNNRVVSMTNGGAIGQRLVANGIPVSHLGMAAGIPDPRGWRRLRQLLVRFRPQVVQTWMYHADLLGALATGGLPNTNLVWGLHHSDLSWRLNKPQTLLVARLCAALSRRAPRAIICCSEATRSAHRVIGYDSEKLVVIHNGYDTELFRPEEAAREALRNELQIPRQSPVISLIARFHPQKDHQGFVKAASIIHRGRRDVHFVLCGAGAVAENRVLAEWIGSGELASRFHLLGGLKDVRRVMAGSTVVASSSAGEGMSNVIWRGHGLRCGVRGD
jgi:glycosyltransferase involved in cell wall biosynthesis